MIVNSCSLLSFIFILYSLHKYSTSYGTILLLNIWVFFQFGLLIYMQKNFGAYCTHFCWVLGNEIAGPQDMQSYTFTRWCWMIFQNDWTNSAWVPIIHVITDTWHCLFNSGHFGGYVVSLLCNFNIFF